VEFALKIPGKQGEQLKKWGIENPVPIVAFVQSVRLRFQSLNPGFELGAIDSFEARSLQRIIHVTVEGSDAVVVGMLPNLSREQVQENMKKVQERWAS
jgi:hypothetical protein